MRFTVSIALISALAIGCAQMTGKEHEDKDHDSGTKSVKIDASQLPANVMTAFQKDHPNSKLEKVEKETYADGTVHYELEWKDSSGKEHDAEYNTEGEQLEKH